ncbi:MAG: AsmA family protein [Pseudomonadota bacterium]
MKKTLKIIAWLVTALVVTVVAAAIIIPLVIDPNDYRDEISAAVKEHTGRELTIEGEIELSLFPWLGVRLGAMQLSNAEGFGPAPFARIGTADVRVKLLPLLRSEVEMEKIVLHGLEANLGRRADGSSNWDDLVGAAAAAPAAPAEKKPTETAPAEPAAALGALALGGLELRDAKVVWDDRQAGARYAVEHLNLAISAIRLNEPFDIALEFDVDSSQPQLRGHLRFASHVTLDLQGQKYRLDTTTLAADVQSALIPGGKASARLQADVQADLKAQTAGIAGLRLEAQGVTVQGKVDAANILAQPDARGSLQIAVSDAATLLAPFQAQLPPGMQPASLQGTRVDAAFDLSLGQQTVKVSTLDIQALGLAIKGQLQGSRIIDAPQFNGRIELGEFVPQDLLASLGIALPEMADPSALTKAALGFDFAAGLDHAALSKLQLRFDDSTLTGAASVRNFQQPALRYDITLDAIDADRYLPPPKEQPVPATPATAAAAGAAQLPPETLAQLRALDVEGTARIGKLKVMNLRSTDIHATVKAAGGLLRVHPVGAKLYGGGYDGNLSFDVRGNVPLIGMDEKLAGVQAGPLLKDFMGKDYVTGTANVSARLTARGIAPMQVRRSLNGTAAFSFTDGAVNGINIAQLIRNAYASYQKQPAPADEVRSTDFAAISGSVTIKDGLVTNTDLKANSPLFRVEGRGTAHLATEALDYLVRAAIVGTLEGQGGKTLSDLKGLTVPLRISGSFTEPKFNVELGALLDEKAKQALEAEKKKVQEALAAEQRKAKEAAAAEKKKAQQKLDAEKKKAREEAEQKLKDALKLR